jgi:hypothetical protein
LVLDEDLEVGDALAEIAYQVADLLGGLRPVRVGSHTQQVHGWGADLQHEKPLDPL